MFRTIFSVAFCAVLSVSTTVNAQDTSATVEKTDAPTKMTLDVDGKLVGTVYANVEGKKKPVEAKLTLIREGVKVKSVFADEKGSFSFGNVAPGKYSVTGSAANYVGMAPVAVVAPAPVASPTAAPVQDNSFVLSAPSYGSVNGGGTVASCGGGYGGGFGGGRLLGGNRRLLRLGLIGGVVAIAVSGDNDMSPDE